MSPEPVKRRTSAAPIVELLSSKLYLSPEYAIQRWKNWFHGIKISQQ